MDKLVWPKYNIGIREWLRVFNLMILEFSDLFPHSVQARLINKRLTRYKTSMHTNFGAAFRGRSNTNVFSKLSLIGKKLMNPKCGSNGQSTLKLQTKKIAEAMHTESLELFKILASMRKCTGNNLSQLSYSILCIL
jgi:hypothetical protein